jgi:hypothetical protein
MSKNFGGTNTAFSKIIPCFIPSLGATAQGEFWPPEQSASILHPRLIMRFLNNLVFTV